MKLTVSKRFEFSASRRLHLPELTDAENTRLYGKETTAKYGSGQNYIAHFIFSGPIDERTGFLINVTEIKKRVNKLLLRYDHRFLNYDTPPFDRIPPTAERVAGELLLEALPLFTDLSAKPVSCHIAEDPSRGATAYADGRVETIYGTRFSAARSTRSPHLSEQENIELFGPASSPSGHGHEYHLRVTLTGEVDAKTGLIIGENEVADTIGRLAAKLDHKNLSHDVAALRNIPTTTECLARFCFDALAENLPIARVRLDERSDFFAEYEKGKTFRLGMARDFHAAHRLRIPQLSDSENQAIYGKCSNEHGHGHRYRVEATLGGKLDETSGTLFHFLRFEEGLARALEPWEFKQLDLEIEDFAGKTSTGENIVSALWPRINRELGGRLVRLRLWETSNNRFTMRRE